MVINQDSLNEGRVALMTFKSNREVADYAMLLPWNASHIMERRIGLCWGFDELLDPEEFIASSDHLNEP
jgi:hypothetical protein